MQCGITCLQMVCKHYGKELSIETLSRYCFATTEGVSLLGISEAANKLGLHSICGKVSMEQMQEAPLPCILHWNQNHFVVLYKQKRGKKFYIADPGKGLVTYSRKEFAEHWVSTRSQGEEKGIAMFLQPTPLFYEQEGETHAGKRSFKFLFGYVKQYRRYFGQILLGALVGCLLQLVFPFLTQAIVDVVIPQGKVTAIVGTSGSGKTTMIKLLLGYYRTLGGSITIGNTDLQVYNLKWWRRHCGVVMQDGAIFSESIARNIAVGDGEIDKERLQWSARIACIEDYILSLPLKYNTLIGQDGVGLSQGQKQRILIARAVYKNPDYIFLDEATNALDANNERAIVENLMEFYRGKTVVVVAHRLSTVRNADQLVVVEKGKIVETGTHEELIQRQGAYWHLVKNQLELGG